MNKDGYIFIETIIVLTVTMVCLLSLYNGYSLTVNSMENRKYYDNINDVYKTNVVKKLLNTEITDEIIDSNNCINYMNKNCNLILEELKIDEVYLTSNVTNLIEDDSRKYKNSLIKYLKTLEADTDYIIIAREKNNKSYYASLKVGEDNE